MNVVKAKATIRELGLKAASIRANASLSTAQKNAELTRMMGELQEAQSVVDLGQKAAAFGIAGDLLDGGAAARPGFGSKGRAPRIRLNEGETKQLWEAVQSKSRLRLSIETKATGEAGDLLPAQLLPGIVGKAHEPVRMLEHIPSTPMGAPAIEFVVHTGTTGSAATVAAGTPKPRVTIGTDKVILYARKIAAWTALEDETLADFPTFAQFVQSELVRIITDAENDQILNGGGTGEDLLGLFNQGGILTRDHAADHTADDTITSIDTLEQAITDLRTGAALTEPDTIVMHPTTWSKLRRTKDSMGRYLLNADPTSSEANSVWGIPVLATTTCSQGEALVANVSEGASAFIRQGVTLDVSHEAALPNDDDTMSSAFVENRTAFRIEERIALGSQRPKALLKVTNL